jgi:hypothetical protein
MVTCFLIRNHVYLSFVPELLLFQLILRTYSYRGKFYLVDSGVSKQTSYLASYKGTKCHLPEFRQGPSPQGSKELFNYYHSFVRNVIERSFGALKMKWRILLGIPTYLMEKQSKIIL